MYYHIYITLAFHSFITCHSFTHHMSLFDDMSFTHHIHSLIHGSHVTHSSKDHMTDHISFTHQFIHHMSGSALPPSWQCPGVVLAASRQCPGIIQPGEDPLNPTWACIDGAQMELKWGPHGAPKGLKSANGAQWSSNGSRGSPNGAPKGLKLKWSPLELKWSPVELKWSRGAGGGLRGL